MVTLDVAADDEAAAVAMGDGAGTLPLTTAVLSGAAARFIGICVVTNRKYNNVTTTQFKITSLTVPYAPVAGVTSDIYIYIYRCQLAPFLIDTLITLPYAPNVASSVVPAAGAGDVDIGADMPMSWISCVNADVTIVVLRFFFLQKKQNKTYKY